MISVIIPVYNAETWLEKCLDSITAQTVFENLEVVLIDDGSSDRSAGIIDDYAGRHKNVVVRHIENGGVSNARNTGLDLAQGEYIAFIDADDYVDADYFEHLINEMDDTCDMVCSGFMAEYTDKSIVRCCREKKELDAEEAVKAFLIGGELEPNSTDKLFRRKLLQELRFDRSLVIAEDKYFIYCYLEKVRRIRMVPEAKYHYVMNDSSACRKRFSAKKFDSLVVAERISSDISVSRPHLKELAECMAIDVKCRVLGEIYRDRVQREFPEEVKKLKRDIRKFSLMKKVRISNKKHTLALAAAKISPYLYSFLKNNMKMQYK